MECTITLSNFGMIAGLVVVPPQVAIVGAGRTEQRVVVEGGQPPRPRSRRQQ
jgi:2-oxoisovalerate dehydrogenase E2 component (dihydrolipoyl transacylase)